jgi:hypothetical protein
MKDCYVICKHNDQRPPTILGPMSQEHQTETVQKLRLSPGVISLRLMDLDSDGEMSIATVQ